MKQSFSFFTIVVSFKLKKNSTIQAQLPLIYASMFQELTCKILL